MTRRAPKDVQHSPDPGVPQTADKAKWGAITGFIVAGGPTLFLVLQDGKLTLAETIAVVVAAVGGPALVGATVQKVRNRPL